MNLLGLPMTLALLWTVGTPASAEGVTSWHHRIQFQRWFNQYGFVFEKLLSRHCSSEYEHYLYDTATNATIYWDEGGGTASTLVQPVVSCLLDSMPQFIMSNMQSAQVFLGLTPTILAILGASTEESATLAVIGQRPFLSLMLACGSPSVYLSRAFEFKDPVEILSKHRPQHYRPGIISGKSSTFRALLVIIQYTTAFAATANVSMLAYELGTQAICLFASEWVLMPFLWSASVIFLYFMGFGWHRLRVRRVKQCKHKPECNNAECKKPETWVHLLVRRIKCEFRLSVNNGKFHVEPADESKRYIILGWILSVVSVLHIIFGTLTLSSMLFIGPRDALKLIARFVASALACRIITMYELAGLRENYMRKTVDKATMTGNGFEDSAQKIASHTVILAYREDENEAC
ncbi:hypothetical protein QBC37DRAFT_391395 [Rhypophila decipiens]|uniref:Gustatory receptor n=1 Tax=Rhypophila decipiens TaxID=261697 RepID=A0AAN7B431_9PEZI|nr:hypothetical protein QBC37DRAFT_391395 [Rhypophila decipiens]